MSAQVLSNKSFLQDQVLQVHDGIGPSFNTTLFAADAMAKVMLAPVIASSSTEATPGKASAPGSSFNVLPLDEELPAVRAAEVMLFTQTFLEKVLVPSVDAATSGMRSAQDIEPEPSEEVLILEAGEATKDVDTVSAHNFQRLFFQRELGGAPDTFLQPTWCAKCGSFLWGVVDQGYCCSVCSEARCPACAKSGGRCSAQAHVNSRLCL